ncbi:efflux RND transporter permease subunit [Geitlerinema sp. P-1104]|uniref:efflux RND transporter permease subunit n=1 Tax=Geitlerinema sp. P-1104 TaxID=2546230 RepID=UPI001477556B|nr:efflux RND transporter permease subunit [Geitlerinema sp. P-1104]NMG57691.1 efflux RND transporter permease subunit [Geitlerinema sp. P-1104]
MSLRERFNISKWAIQHRLLTIAIWLAIAVAGLFAYSSLQYALFPDITFPVVIVNASGESDDVIRTESDLTEPIEAQLWDLPGLDDIQSRVYPGRTVISVLFNVGVDLTSSSDAVRDRLNQLELPDNTELEVIPLNLNESAAISYALRPTPDSDLEAIAPLTRNQLIPQLEQLPGVLRVDLLGDAEISQDSEPDLLTDDVSLNAPTLIRFASENALALQVIKEGDANTLDVVRQVETTVATWDQDYPQLQIDLAATQADFIREATQATIDTLGFAIILAVIVIFAFLRNLWATLITALAIPISLLGTFIVMAVYDFNLETITLLALALTIGIIVDDAIVEVENIARHIDQGQPPREAAIAATNEIGLTVSASTLTIVAVFLPVAFMGGTIGQFFKPFGLTVSAAVLISLLVARTLSPVLAVYWLKPKPQPQGDRPETPNLLDRLYLPLLRNALGHPWLTLAIAVLSLVVGIALIPLIPKGFIPQLDRGEFNILYTAPLPEFPSPSDFFPQEAQALEFQDVDPAQMEDMDGDSPMTLPDSDPRVFILNASQEIAADLEAVVRDHPDVESVYTLIGYRGEPNRGRLSVQLRGDRQLDTASVQSQLRDRLPRPDGSRVSVEDIQFVEIGDSKPLQIALLGDDLDQLNQTARTIATAINDVPGLIDIETSADPDGDLASIRRKSGERVAYVEANLRQGQALGDATDDVVAIAQDLLPPDIRLDLGGDAQNAASVFRSFGGTLALSVTCMLAVLILPFGRLLEPLVVGLSLPLALIGALFALLITQSDFGMISLIGTIFLLGLLDKNALLLMDYANQLRKAGKPRLEALLETGRVRFRPILMTTASTVLGMLPIAIGWGAGAELRQPMAVAIIGGLITSSLLSLVVVPVLYGLLEDGWSKLRRR